MSVLHRTLYLVTLGMLLLGGRCPLGASEPSGTSRLRVIGSSEDSSAKAWADAQRWYASNDFAQAQSAAGLVTSGPSKKDAQAMLSRIKQYVSALQEGTDAEIRHDLVDAIKAYATAVRIKSDGPGDPAARIVRIQQQAAAAVMSEKEQEALRLKQLAKRRAQATSLVEKGKAEEASGDLKGALSSYTAALADDSGNHVAHEGATRLKAQMQSSSNHKDLVAAAVRSFYAGQFAEAEQQLAPLSADAGTKWRGAAAFYLGASRLYRILQEKDVTAEQAFRDTQAHAAFQQAKALGYAPASALISPTLLRLWQGLH